METAITGLVDYYKGESIIVSLAKPLHRQAEAPFKRVMELDGLRAIAILLVIGCHYPGFSDRLWRLPQLGWVGVDIFFALSGYLITAILLGLRDKASPYKTFYARRMIRILPPYALMSLVLLPGIYFEHQVSIAKYLISQAFFLQGFRAVQIAGFLQRIHHPLGMFLQRSLAVMPSLTPTFTGAAATYWSLSAEEYFYLLWAPIVLHFSKRSVAWIAGAICVLELLIRWVYSSNFSYMLTHCRFDALLFGAFIALLLGEVRMACAVRIFALSLFFSATALCVLCFFLRPILGHEPRSALLFSTFGLTRFLLRLRPSLGC